jgi:GntR family transcriptional regulator
VPIEVTPPKYIKIINALQQRIEDGTYPTGATLPSETRLIEEFDVSRPTVVRALEIMRQQGWIDAQHGKGRTVRGKPATGGRTLPAHTAALLDASEIGAVDVLEAGPVIAPPRAATALGLRDGAAVIARRRLMRVDGVGPVELSAVYVPVELASGTGVGELHPLTEGLLPHLAARKRIEFDHVVERVSARIATADETRLLELPKRDAVLTLLLTICDPSGAALLAIDMVLPASRHELEDVFPLR